MAKKKTKKDLGLGIRALLSGMDTDTGDSLLAGTGQKGGNKLVNFSEIDVDEIEVNPFQPRADFDEEALEALSKSIAVHGVIQPITVRRVGNDYQLIAGERRLRASKRAGKETIPAYIRTADDQEMLEIALIENVQRQDLNPIEMAVNYLRLKEECKLSDLQVAERLGMKRSTITNFLRLLRLPPEVKNSLIDRKISKGHAMTLAGIEEVDIQLFLHKEIIENGLSVRQAEAKARQYSKHNKKKKTKSPASSSLSPTFKQIQDQLAAFFESKVELKRDQKGKGQVTIPFTSDDDLNRILELLKK